MEQLATPASRPSWPGEVELLDPPGRTLMFRTVIAVLALEPLVVLVVLLAIGVPLWIVACVVAFVIIGIPMLGAGVVAMIWTPFTRRYPPQSIQKYAVGKSYQSFGFGALSRLNNCIHIAADESHLHLIPMKPLQWCGARPASLPWNRIVNPEPSVMPGFIKAHIDNKSILGPAWCMKLAGERGSAV